MANALFREDFPVTALLIFYSKVDVYLRALGKTPTAQWRQWIG